MQQIEQLGRVLGKLYADLLGLNNDGRINQGMENTDRDLSGALDLDIHKMMGEPAHLLIDQLKEKGTFSKENVDKICDIIILTSHGLEPSNPERAKRLNWCLDALELLEKSSSDYSMDRHSKINEVRKMLQE